MRAGSILFLSMLAGCAFDASGISTRAGDSRADQSSDTRHLDAVADSDSVPEDRGVADGVIVLPDLFAGCPQCPLGCRADASTCRQYTPSNIDQSELVTLSKSSCGKVVFQPGSPTIATSSCTISGATVGCAGTITSQSQYPGKTACIMVVQTLDLPVGVKVAVQGQHPLILIATGAVNIAGELDASANATTPGPGGNAGGVPPSKTVAMEGEGDGGGKVCSCSDASHDDCGGGGGGFGTAGGRGGQEDGGCSTAPAPGGQTYGTDSLSPLVGGSGGASGHNTSSDSSSVYPGAGGAGGGAVQISSQEKITLAGSINAGGGGGQPGPMDSNDRSAGGGGSGGAVLLEAPQISGAGLIAANGGGGGAGTDNPADCGAGEDGQPSSSVAKGGQYISGALCNPGGDGAASSIPAQAAVDVPDSLGGAGGGGGGLGRIRLNWLKTKYPSPSLKLSGKQSTGEIQPF